MHPKVSIAKRNPAHPPKRVELEHLPSQRLAAALRDMKAGRFVEYDSVEAIRADIEAQKRKLSGK